MLEEHRRRVHHGDIIFEHFVKDDGNNYLKYDFGKFCIKNFLELASENIDNQKEIRRSRAKVKKVPEIKAIEIKDNHAVILIDVTHMKGAAAGYKDISNGEVEVHGKKAEQGFNYSSHLIINLITNQNGVYEAKLEVVDNIDRSIINSMLTLVKNIVFKNNKEFFELEQEDDKGKLKSIRTQLSFNPKPNDDFWKIIANNGAIAQLSMINKKFINDDSCPIGIDKKEVTFNSKDLYKNKNKDMKNEIKSLCDYAKNNNYEALRVNFNDENDNSKTVYIDSTSSKVNIDNFIMYDYIEVASPLATCHLEINNEIVNLMKNL